MPVARRREIAVQERHRQLVAFLAQASRNADVHPRAGAFVGAREEVHVEACDAFAITIMKPEEAGVLVPYGNALVPFEADAEHPPRDVEQRTDHRAEAEIRFEQLVRQVKL